LEKATGQHPVQVSTALVREVDIPEVYRVTGSVVSDNRIDLASRVVGFIQTLDVREGQRVAKGEILVRIDPSDIDEAIRQAQAEVDAVRETLKDAEEDVKTYSDLVDSGAVASEEARKTKVRRDIALATLARAEAALAAAQAQRDYTTIVSPVNGVILTLHKRSGELATAGTPILTLESREVLLFKVFVSESNMGRISSDMQVPIQIDALPDRPFMGTVRRIVPSGDPVTRRYEILIALPSDHALLPGMFGRAEIVMGDSPAITVPRKAVLRQGGLDGVFVVGPGQTARFRWVRLGREWNGLVEVTSGLGKGETIITQAGDSLRDGVLLAAGGVR
jgi:RND family efflux transporter MFP subunit